MASSANPYILAAQVGLAATSSYMNYQADVEDAQKSLLSLGLQKESSELRHNQSVRSIRKRSRAFQARQKGAYVSSGVKLEGSAITALGDALADELEAVLAQEQSFEETQTSLMLSEADARSRRSSAGTKAALSFLGSSAQSYAQYKGRK